MSAKYASRRDTGFKCKRRVSTEFTAEVKSGSKIKDSS